MTGPLTLRRAEKYGFCAGVRIADRTVRQLAAGGRRGQILGQLVHNERVVSDLVQLGFGTAAALDEVENGTVVFSAHGVPPSFHRRALERGLVVVDTTCPFVYDVHEEARLALEAGYHLVFIGDARHREVIGYTRDLDPEAYDVVLTAADVSRIDWERHPKVKIFYQTTLNSEEYEQVARTIEARAAEAERADTICYATKENQDAARALAADPEIDCIVVVGGRRSANTRHLWEICREIEPRSHLVHDSDDLRRTWFEECRTVGITAGASTPDAMIEEVEAAILETAP
ncbi:MAG: 4-hydroxy-3-methylbut-2-enyl diphosphate reductase [Acidobacteriota bacterium]|nr:4-hydroxy-3-methylbut-2-enyl diphosphate reductase [Acidobacteriota bacterium]